MLRVALRLFIYTSMLHQKLDVLLKKKGEGERLDTHVLIGDKERFSFMGVGPDR